MLPEAHHSYENYKYRETAFVFGSLKNYVQDLEKYFRWSMRTVASSAENYRKSLDRLYQDVEFYEKCGFFWFDSSRNGIPFPVNKTNYKTAAVWLSKKAEFNKKRLKAQKINHGRLMGILADGKNMEQLNLVNYAYDHHVVMIRYVAAKHGEKKEAIRMRVFFDDNSGLYRQLARSFAESTGCVVGVHAECRHEDDIDENVPHIDSFISSGKTRRNSIVVKEPVFEINRHGDETEYQIQLSKEDMEMMEKFYATGYRKPEWAIHCSNSWSDYQGEKILRNLFGVLAAESPQKQRGRRNRYSDFYLPKKNEEAAKNAMENNGIFRKSVSKESLPVLQAVYDRSVELKSKYGKDFYPRFTATEVSKRTGLKKEEVSKHFDGLTGLLMEVMEQYIFWHGNHYYRGYVKKYFIPKTRMAAAEKILAMNGPEKE